MGETFLMACYSKVLHYCTVFEVPNTEIHPKEDAALHGPLE